MLWEIISGKVPFLDVPSPPPPPSAPLLTSITKNFSFQSIASSLTGYDTGSAHHGHGHSRQSIDSKKVPNRISTRNQVLSGYRPEIPPCPPDYAEIIRMGWSADHYHRPSAHGTLWILQHNFFLDLVVQLENLLRKYLPANMMLIEVSFPFFIQHSYH